jgi:predicted site-specific integrase-resolvase
MSKNVKETARYIAPGKARNILGVSDATLRRWAAAEKIKSIVTPTGRRLYDVESFGGRRGAEAVDAVLGAADVDAHAVRQPSTILYARVSSSKQRDDLERQIDFLKNKYPDAEVISDVGSGINWSRKGLRKLLGLSRSGDIDRVVVAERDRLCRFAFELLEYVFGINGTIVEVVNAQDSSAEQELQEDLLSIVQIFCCRRNGRRRYGPKGTPKDEDTGGPRDRDPKDQDQPHEEAEDADR